MNQDKSQPRKPEKISRRAKMTLFALGGVLVLCMVALVLISVLGPKSPTEDINVLEGMLDAKLHSLADEGLTVKFTQVKTIPGGPGLNDWLQAIPAKDRIKSVSIAYTAFYSIDKSGDWELTIKDGRLNVFAPAPDLKTVNVEPSSLKIETNGAELTGEERNVAAQILRENLSSVVREEEERGRAARVDEIRKTVRGFVAGIFPGRDPAAIDVIFPGEGTSSEEGP